MKKEDFIGVWKLVDYCNGKVITSKTHLVVKDDILWEVWPNIVYYENQPGPEVKYTFEEGTPAKVALSSGFKYLAKRTGNQLFFKLGPVYGYYPDNFQDSGNLGTYVLETEDIAKTLRIPPPRVKVEELKMRGFSTLKYDTNLAWWEGQTKFQDKKITLHISAEKTDKFGPLEDIKERLNQLKPLDFHQIAADGLLSLFNENWNPNDTAINAEQFKEKLHLREITLERDGSASIWFDDGDLFAGHSILVALDDENKVTDTGIMG